jgi:hypothetical protein
VGFLDLFRPKWKHSDSYVRKAAAKELTDQAVLTEIAKTDQDADVRKAVVEKLTDQEALADVAESGKHRDARFGALEKVVNEAALAEIAKSSTNGDIRLAAAVKLSDATVAQVIYAQIARSDSDGGVRQAAVKKLTDQTAFAEIAMTDAAWEVRLEAVTRLSDEAVLAEVVKKPNELWDVRKAAVGKLTDQALLAEIAKTARDRDVCRLAAERLEDKSLAMAILAEKGTRAGRADAGAAPKGRLELLEKFLSAYSIETQRKVKPAFDNVKSNFEFVTWVPVGMERARASEATERGFKVWYNADAKSVLLYGAGVVATDAAAADTVMWLQSITVHDMKAIVTRG